MQPLSAADYRRVVLRLVDAQQRQAADLKGAEGAFAAARQAAATEVMVAGRAYERSQLRLDRAAARVSEVERATAAHWRALAQLCGRSASRLGPPPVADAEPRATEGVDPAIAQRQALARADHHLAHARRFGIGKPLPPAGFLLLPAIGGLTGAVVTSVACLLPALGGSAGLTVIAVFGTFLAPFAGIPAARWLVDRWFAARLDSVGIAVTGLCGLAATATMFVWA